MSNVGRPRTGLKPCKHCKSTRRDSNGQCACRNAAYRAARKAAKGKSPTALTKAAKAADAKKALDKKASEKRTAPKIDTRAITHALKDTGESFICLCGFEGKGTAPSIRSHVARAVKEQETA